VTKQSFYEAFKRQSKPFRNVVARSIIGGRVRIWSSHVKRSYRFLFWSKIPAAVRKVKPLPVRYRYFSTLNTEDFEKFVSERVENPTKLCTLDWLAKERLLDETFTVLDIGCGPGIMAQMIANHPTLKHRVVYTGVDQSENALNYARKVSPETYSFIRKDVLAEGAPGGYYDVIIISEVVEHMPDYETIVDIAISKKPKIVVLTAFAVEPLYRNDRVRWNREDQCYMNSYAFHRVHEKLRSIAANRPLYIADFGTAESSANPWFPRKTHTVFYLPLAAPVTIDRNAAYAPYIKNHEGAERFWGECYRAGKQPG
jgi:2-polyprenyl-3-methyl-5-hydroxy-6-metoxy-1,4-benzoquinol methylase